MLQSGRPAPNAFGKRGASPGHVPQEPRARAALASEVSPAGDIQEAAAAGFRPSDASLAWPYIKACAVAFATVIAVSVAFGGSNNPMAGKSLFQNIVGAVVAPTLGGVMAVPAFLLAQLASVLRIPRGVADVIVGGVLGSAWLLLALSDGKPIVAQHYAFLLGGCFGGFAFWRAQGYPGATAKAAKVLDQVYSRSR